eukprot:scaffold481065_cov31-Prasinocladus_malaysianus.AAC.1
MEWSTMEWNETTRQVKKMNGAKIDKIECNSANVSTVTCRCQKTRRQDVSARHRDEPRLVEM